MAKKPPSKKSRKSRVPKWLRQTFDVAPVWIVKALIAIGIDRFTDWL